ncbi:hypothetical protein ACHAWU_001995 [Discostella pseudostelligera]|uniref:Uncharacterized protein n=1 Tax=Discostella pseudostelligera TaxID=259834 RepID=A0ABD3MIJ1_9STRA
MKVGGGGGGSTIGIIPMRATTTVFAEDADYEAQFKKLQQEAEDRLEEKVQELMKNVDNVGAK